MAFFSGFHPFVLSIFLSRAECVWGASSTILYSSLLRVKPLAGDEKKGTVQRERKLCGSKRTTKKSNPVTCQNRKAALSHLRRTSRYNLNSSLFSFIFHPACRSTVGRFSSIIHKPTRLISRALWASWPLLRAVNTIISPSNGVTRNGPSGQWRFKALCHPAKTGGKRKENTFDVHCILLMAFRCSLVPILIHSSFIIHISFSLLPTHAILSINNRLSHPAWSLDYFPAWFSLPSHTLLSGLPGLTYS